MEKINIYDVDGTVFPAGRKTRVIIGEAGKIKNKDFAQGFVEIYPGGSVPTHNHANIESYTILKGCGEMVVNDNSFDVKEGDVIYIQSGEKHTLKNTSSENMIMMFVYTPGNIVDHWDQELKSKE